MSVQKICVLLIGLAFVASCGVDGAPVRPSGSAKVMIGSGGISVGGSVSATKGPFTLAVKG